MTKMEQVQHSTHSGCVAAFDILNIQVIGPLVGSSEVQYSIVGIAVQPERTVAAEDCEGDPALLPPGEALHLLQRQVARHAELAENLPVILRLLPCNLQSVPVHCGSCCIMISTRQTLRSNM